VVNDRFSWIFNFPKGPKALTINILKVIKEKTKG